MTTLTSCGKLTGRDYLLSALPLLLLAAFLAWDVAAGEGAAQRDDALRRQCAETFWTHMIADDRVEGWHENGDCFLYAIRLRDKLKAETNTDGTFTFVEWTNLRQGPNIHVYTEFDVLGQTWVIDNMTGLHKFPGGTIPAQWVAQVAPRDTPYKIIGGTKDLVDFVARGEN